MPEKTTEERVISMYDVRGIQTYIFRTDKVKDAIGASRIVENIIREALETAVEKFSKFSCQKIQADLQWCEADRYLTYKENTQDIQVLFIGGGNAFVMYRSRNLCLEINKLMSRYVLQKTYSLQLAAAIINKGDDYAEDYQKLHREMNKTKADMVISRPLGTLPIMDMEIKTGYPAVSEDESTETKLKKNSGTQKQRKIIDREQKIFDNYVTKKGIDSTIAVVHIDGNSMGKRIRDCISGISDYTEAVNEMRKISFHISYSYKKAFDDMSKAFNVNAGGLEEFRKKEKRFFIREILVAGDDITFVCNGKIALAAVEYYCRKISGFTMNGEKDEESVHEFGFSVCAGIAYIGSHFPFCVGYNVAESCCEAAKKRAKQEENMDGERTGNFVDFHICKNIHAQNFKHMREKEYVTSSGEQLLIRPYYIHTEKEGDLCRLNNEIFAFDDLKKSIAYFQDEENMPRSFSKKLRNAYALGKSQVDLFYSFLESRGWKMPEGMDPLYTKENVARWYDALEILDDYVDLEAIEGGEV